ncbi:MAG: tRNA (guanosine(37)-N1)-methyltransferase TrmD [Clostridia bacterium]|nr:tRNA (guanosine(37)-N1)-methyltransferase TrmD [Clostridia bacterium]
MRIDIMTLFPGQVEAVLSESIIGRAREAGLLDIRSHNIRDYSEDRHRRVDDTPCGGGMGMLMAAPPIMNCFDAITADCDTDAMPKVLYMSPRGKTFTQDYAKELAGEKHIVILCGHYEGVDQRAIDLLNAEEVSIGDYVLTGGELAACIITDSVGRLIPGVLPEAEAHEIESFEDDLLEFPQYTRPIEYRGLKVPEILLSGHHANIDKWRREQAEALTEERRPDLFAKYYERKAKAEAEKEAKRQKRLRYKKNNQN